MITPAKRPGIGFVFMLRWLHINLCKWRLWLYFHRASKAGITGLLPEKEREKAMNVAERKFSLSISTLWDFQPENQPQIHHYTAYLYKNRFTAQSEKKRLLGIKKILKERQKMKTEPER